MFAATNKAYVSKRVIDQYKAEKERNKTEKSSAVSEGKLMYSIKE